ncbi:GAF domain-containing protein [Bordetella sp. N]|uniref:helix-turn-helix domain-containing protein n=1 Tax=Bordetella sp. N TaxID=1746199 RepID=UPI00070990F3|nr:GAF domain-containing protein [Bordetella sp. N]ALM81593.1 sugar diacid utilization regulator [Bordetella sp. N]
MKRPAPSHTAVRPCAPAYAEMLRLLDQAAEPHAALTALLLQIEQRTDDAADREALLAAAHRALAIGERLDQHQRNELALRAVFESAQTLTELKELDDVLFDIVERGRRLLGSDLAWLAGVHPQTGDLGVLAVSGVYSNETKDTHTALNAGVAGHVRRTRSPFATSDYMGDTHFEHTPENDLMIQREGLRSLVAAPLLAGAEVAGILIVGDRYARTYHPREVSILATLAAHASVAMRNAKAFDLTRQALQDTEQANQRLIEQTAALELAADAHERLTRLLARGAPLKDLISTVADILDGRVMFLDAAGLELCVATPLDYAPPEVSDTHRPISGIDARIQSAVGLSRTTGRATTTQSDTGSHCQVAAVTSKDELFGALVIQTGKPMTESAVRILERSATATAVLLLSAEKSSATLDQDINLTIRALLETGQHEDDGLAARFEKHGVDIRKPTMLAMIHIEKTDVAYVLRKLSTRLRHTPHLATDIDGRIVMVLNPGDRKLEDDLHALLFQELSFRGVACVSGPYVGIDGLDQAHAHLKRAIGLLRALRRADCVVHEAALRMYAVLFEHQSAADLDAIIGSVVGRLTDHDSRRNTQLADTLLSYLDNMQNARATAVALQIHVNTLHNRLDAIAALLGPWDSDGRVADVHLALRLRRLKSDLPASGRRTAKNEARPRLT